MVRSFRSHLVAIAALATSASAQIQLREFTSNHLGAEFGTSVARAGDLDGDGRDEVLVGAPGYGAADVGRAFVYAGVDGSEVYVLVGATLQGRFGEAVDGGHDVDGDQVPDLLIGAPLASLGYGAGDVYVHSGFDGAQVFEADRGNCATSSSQLGWTVSAMEDFDGDGRCDVAFGSNTVSVDDGGITTVVGYRPFQQDKNQVLWSIDCACWCPESFGISVDSGDINGDGLADVIVGMYDFNFELRAYLGPDGTLAWKHDIGGNYSLMMDAHEWVEVIGDVNGDGKDDFALATILPGSTVVSVRSGDTGTELFSFPTTGGQLGAPGDFDGDGVPDLLVGAPGDDTAGPNAGAAYVYSGAGLGLLAAFYGSKAFDRFGASVDGAGDVNGDGVPDIIVGAPGGPGGGYARVFSGTATPLLSTYCQGKINSQGCLPFIDWGGDPTLTGPDDFLVLTRDALVGKPGLFFYGLDGTIAVPFFGAQLCVRPPLVRTIPTNAMGPSDCSAGNAFHFSQALMAAEGLQAGDVVQGQFWMRDPAHPDGTGVGLTNAITIPILP